MSKRKHGLRVGALFFIVAAMSLIAGLLPTLRGRATGVPFLGAAVVFFGVAARK